MRLDVVTLIDTCAHEAHAGDPHIGDTYARQMAAADLFLVTVGSGRRNAIQITTRALTKTRQAYQYCRPQMASLKPTLFCIGRVDNAALSPSKRMQRMVSGNGQGILRPKPTGMSWPRIRGLSPHIIRAKGFFPMPKALM